MLTNKLFQAIEYPLEIYNNQPILDTGFQFYYDDCGTDVEFDFPGYISSYLRVFNERGGRTIKDIPLTRTGNILVINSTDTEFEDNGKYYYEVGYLQTGGYELPLRYGNATVI